MSRLEKRDKLLAVYAKAVDVMHASLGRNKEHVYAACQALQTVSRELGIMENVIAMKERSRPAEATGTIGWADVSSSPADSVPTTDASA